MSSPSNDAALCQELAQLGNPLFRLSCVFAGEQQEILTAIHAFFASIQNIGSSLQEEEVARRKIRWWQNECQPGNLEVSSHPVLRELVRMRGGHDCQVQMQAILAGAESRLENTPPSDEASFNTLCREIGAPLVDLEMRVSGCSQGLEPDMDGIVLRRGLWSLICETFGPKGHGRSWWLPMSLMARAGLSREELYTSPDGQACRDLYYVVIKNANINSHNTDISDINHNLTNLYALDTLVRKRLEKLSKNVPAEYPALVQKAGISDLLAAWSVARKVNRQR